ncbi:copper ion transmembrane transporter [Tanacetum coccineum]
MTPITVVEILKNNGLVVEKKVVTSTTGMKDETRGQLIQKAKNQRQENGYDYNSINATRKFMNKDGRRKIHSGLDSSGIGSNHRENRKDWRKDSKRGNNRKVKLGLESKILDMNLQDDGSYEISKKEMEIGPAGVLRAYLKGFATVDDRRTYVEFGEGPIDKMNQDWKYYARVLK